MDERILSQIIPIVEKTKEGILKGVEFAQQQVPDLIQEILKWNFTISLIGCLVGVLFLISCIPIYKFFNRVVLNDRSFVGIQALTLLPFGIGIVVTFCNLVWLKILVAPKLFLIEYISNLIK